MLEVDFRVGRDDLMESAGRRGYRPTADLDPRQILQRQIDQRIKEVEDDGSDGHWTTLPRDCGLDEVRDRSEPLDSRFGNQ